MKKQLGQQAAAGPVRDLAIQAAGVVDGDPITDDINLGEDVDEEVGVISALGVGASGSVVTKEGDLALEGVLFVLARRRYTQESTPRNNYKI